MSEKATTEHLLKCAINHSNCSIVDAFREFHQSGEISNNAELILDAAEFFQKLAKELQLENEQLAKDKTELVEALQKSQQVMNTFGFIHGNATYSAKEKDRRAQHLMKAHMDNIFIKNSELLEKHKCD